MAVSQSLTLTESSYSVENNTSQVRILWTSTQSGSSYNSTTNTGYYWISINGGAEERYSVTSTLPQSSTKTILDKTITVNHKSDGTGSISVRTSFNTYISAGTVTKSASKTLTTIPRASNIDSCSTSLNTNGTCALTWTPKSTSFRYKVAFSLGNWSYTTDYISPASTSQQSYSYNLPSNSLLAQLPTSVKGTMSVELQTYSGTTEIGSNTKSVTINVPSNIVPSIGTISSAFTSYSYNGGTSTSLLIKNLNKITVSVSGCAAGTGSTILSYTFSGQDLNSTITSTATSASKTSNVLSTSGSNLTYTVTIKDARGRTAFKTLNNIQCYDYYQPSISGFNAYRADSNGDADADGTYIKYALTTSSASVNNTNSPTVNIICKKKDDGTQVAAANIDTANKLINLSNDKNSAYIVYATITDKYTSIPISTPTITVLGSNKILNISPDGSKVAIGKKANQLTLDNTTQQYSFECNWPAYFDDNIYVGANKKKVSLEGHTHAAGESEIGSHTHGATDVKMTGYTKASSASAITTSDTARSAIGKLEKALDGKASSSHTHNKVVNQADSSKSIDFIKDTNLYFRPSDANSGRTATFNLGTSARSWDNIYAKNGTIQVSDENYKKDIQDIDDKYILMLDDITPKTFKWKNEEDIIDFTGDGVTKEFIVDTLFGTLDSVTVGGTVVSSTDYTYNATTGKLTFTNAPANGTTIRVKDGAPKITGDRRHVGLIAQDVSEAMTAHNITDDEFAGHCVADDGTEMLRYVEFVPLIMEKIKRTTSWVGEIADDATIAKSMALAAESSASNAATNASNAATSASNAESSAYTAAISASNAATSASTAVDAATAAQGSASSALESATTAGNNASLAQSAADAARKASFKNYGTREWSDTQINAHPIGTATYSWARTTGYYNGEVKIGEVLVITVKQTDHSNRLADLYVEATVDAAAGASVTGKIIQYNGLNAWFWHDSNGAHIADKDGYRTDISGTGLDIKDSSDASVANFSASGARIGKLNSPRFEQTATALSAYDASGKYFEVSRSGLSWGSNIAATTSDVDDAINDAKTDWFTINDGLRSFTTTTQYNQTYSNKFGTAGWDTWWDVVESISDVEIGDVVYISWTNSTTNSVVTISARVCDLDSAYPHRLWTTTIGTQDAIGALAAANAAQTAINNVQIGSRNLLRDTLNYGRSGVDSTETGYLRSCNSTIETDLYNGFSVRHLQSSSANAIMSEYLVNGVSNGDVYTVSFYAKGEGTLRSYFYGPTGYKPVSKATTSLGATSTSSDGNANIPLTSEWVRYWIVYEISSTTTKQKTENTFYCVMITYLHLGTYAV